MGNEIALLRRMISSGGMILRSVRFIWAFALMVALAGVADGWAATKPAPKAKITVQPVKQTADLGASVSLMVTAISPSPVTYQWRLNKVAISGANSASYVIDPVAADSAGQYDVVLTNAGGAVTSKQVVLTVDLAPSSLPVGTALYDEVTVRALGQSDTTTGSWMISSATAVTDPEDNTGIYTFVYKRTAANRATLTVTGSYFDPDFGARFGAKLVYSFTFTNVAQSGERVFKCTGSGVSTAPAGIRPAKIELTFSGTTSIEFPP